MTEEELFTTLYRAFGLGDILAKYRPLKPIEELKKAVVCCNQAKGMRERTTAAAWWEYENHKTLAYVLMGIYCWRVLGHDDFPQLPDAYPEVMRDGHALLCLWSRSLVFDHVHRVVRPVVTLRKGVTRSIPAARRLLGNGIPKAFVT